MGLEGSVYPGHGLVSCISFLTPQHVYLLRIVFDIFVQQQLLPCIQYFSTKHCLSPFSSSFACAVHCSALLFNDLCSIVQQSYSSVKETLFSPVCQFHSFRETPVCTHVPYTPTRRVPGQAGMTVRKRTLVGAALQSARAFVYYTHSELNRVKLPEWCISGRESISLSI